MQDLPENYSLAYNRYQISDAISQVAIDVASWIEHSVGEGEQLLAVCVLRGATFFYSDLLRSIPISIEPSYCVAQSYDKATNVSKGEVISSAANILVKDRCVLLVDDICDSGLTLQALSETFKGKGAKQVRSAVLLNRNTSEEKFTPTWSGIEHKGEEWFVGFGMDDRDSFSNLPEIYVLKG